MQAQAQGRGRAIASIALFMPFAISAETCCNSCHSLYAAGRKSRSWVLSAELVQDLLATYSTCTSNKAHCSMQYICTIFLQIVMVLVDKFSSGVQI